ncbi:ABC transporter substrate-binding protein [Kribbella lupini]|uniref:ABC transporter substrate-binding protein n=2 Tax=Kribbella lupini TaxID=291602 RepID=A0ABP4NI17_9ACTN
MKPIALLAVLVAAAALSVSACGPNSPAAGTANQDAPVYGKLPKNIQESGVLKVGASAVMPPYLYKDGSAVAGFEKELMDALADALGVRLEFQDNAFAALIPGLQSGKIDVAMGNLSDTKERQQVVDLVDYTASYQALLVQKGNPKGLRSPEGLCGTVAAAVVGSLSERIATAQHAECKQASRAGVEVLTFEDATAAVLQVQTKRADVLIMDVVLARYISSTGQRTEVAGTPFYEQYHAAAVRKGNDQLRAAVEAAFTEIMRAGTYDKILAKWHLEELSLPAPKVNAATS